MQHYGDYFESMYKAAGEDYSRVPWARLEPHAELVEWARRRGPMPHMRAAVVGCGLGDDAEFLQKIGFATVAFDISAEAIEAAKRRFPDSRVGYRHADLFALDPQMLESFDLVVEAYTLQSLPNASRAAAIDATASLLRPGGRLLVMALANLSNTPNPPGPPHPVRKRELDRFLIHGYEERSCRIFESFRGSEYMIEYERI